MKLHWPPRSPFVRKVMICAKEKGIEKQIERVRSVVAMKNPNRDLMRTNPLGKIATLVLDDGRVMFDSIVICEYLDSLNGGPPLFPPTGVRRWAALGWHALGYLDFRFADLRWRDKHPRLAAWFVVFSERPSVRRRYLSTMWIEQ